MITLTIYSILLNRFVVRHKEIVLSDIIFFFFKIFIILYISVLKVVFSFFVFSKVVCLLFSSVLAYFFDCLSTVVVLECVFFTILFYLNKISVYFLAFFKIRVVFLLGEFNLFLEHWYVYLMIFLVFV